MYIKNSFLTVAFGLICVLFTTCFAEDTAAIEKDTFLLNEHYLKSQRYLDISHPKKVIITFAGMPCSGKSQLAKKIEKRFETLYLSQNDVRNLIRELTHQKLFVREQSVATRLREYVKFFIQNNATSQKNHLIVLDGAVDRRYLEIKKEAKENGYTLFVIDINASFDEAMSELHERQKQDPRFKDYVPHMKKWADDYETCRGLYSFDYTMKSMPDEKLEEELLFQQIEKVIQ